MFSCTTNNLARPNSAMQVASIAVHYLILVSFMWSILFAVHLYQATVLVQAQQQISIARRSAVAWLTPAVVVIIAAGASPSDYTTDSVCWMDMASSLKYALYVPMFLVTLINVIIYFGVMRSVSREVGSMTITLGTAVTLFMLLGLTWLFGILAVTLPHFAFNLLFALGLVIQGVRNLQ